MKSPTVQFGSGFRVLVYEHVSGGGYAGQPLPPDELAEGFGMLRSFVADLKAAGHITTVLIDGRLSKLNPPLETDCITPVLSSEEPKRLLSEFSKVNDAIYIISPETGQTLQKTVEFVEGTGKVSLNCKSSAIEKVSDKATLYENLEEEGFLVPKFIIREVSDSNHDLSNAIDADLSYPVVFKPADGSSCGGISIVKDKNSIEIALDKIKSATTNKRFVIQEYVRGEPASASVLSNDKKAVTISLNRQFITLTDPSSESKYSGGCVPFNHPLHDDAMILAEKVVESYSGLIGYIGVDLVLSESEVFVVDVNPRLTTSYVGLRTVSGFNVAAAIIDAVVNAKLPRSESNHGVACFSKQETNKPSQNGLQNSSTLAYVISPPFPLENNTKSCALVIGHGGSLDEARLHLEEAKNNLLNIVT